MTVAQLARVSRSNSDNIADRFAQIRYRTQQRAEIPVGISRAERQRRESGGAREGVEDLAGCHKLTRVIYGSN